MGTSLILTSPKTGRTRTVPPPTPSIRVLQEHRQALVVERLAVGPAWTEHDLVFRLASVRFHTLRQSCGAFLVAQGVHLQVIAEISGHSDTRVTSAVDAHVDWESWSGTTTAVSRLR